MSQFLEETGQQRSEVNAPSRGPEEYLSAEERRFLTRILSYPEELPPKFKSWISDYSTVFGGQISASQITGFSQIVATPYSSVLTSESTTSTTFTDLATTGPILTNVDRGQYLVFFGAQIQTSGGSVGVVSPAMNAVAAAEADCAAAGGPTSGTSQISTMRMITTTFTETANTITLKYRTTTGTATFLRRWVIALRIGN